MTPQARPDVEHQSELLGLELDTRAPRRQCVQPLNADACHLLEEAHYKLLRLIDSRPDLSQRELAREMGVSLGKVNYCVNALIEKGWVKARNFRNSRSKLAYAYLLTPRGVEQKTSNTLHFLKRKVAEYESLRREIADLRREVAESDRGGRASSGRSG